MNIEFSRSLLIRVLAVVLLVITTLLSFSSCLSEHRQNGNIFEPQTTISTTDIEADSDSTLPPEDTPSLPENTLPESTDDSSDILFKNNSVFVTMTDLITIKEHSDKNNVNCRIVQGGCTDGTYYYVVLNDGKSSNADSVSAVCKYEIATGKCVATYENIQVAHGNDITYNSKTNELIFVHNAPERKVISIFDADTFTFKEKKTLDIEIFSIAYDPYEECYWVGLSHCYDFAKLDLSFKQIGEKYKGYDTGYTKQGMDVDSRYIYFCQYNINSIIVYDKAGNFVREIALPEFSYEAENICHIGNTFYIGYYRSSSGGVLYKTELSKIETKEHLSLDRHTDANGNICKFVQGSCSDGKYLYQMLNNDKSSKYVTTLVKIDLNTKEIVLTAEGLKTGVTNDITYNSKTKQIIVVHNRPEAKEISIFDSETLTLVLRKLITYSIYGIAYDSVNDCYWAGISGGYNFVCLDTNFEKIGDICVGKRTGYSKQGMDCDGTYIYFLQSATNSIVIYKKDGTFAGIISLCDIDNSAQSICHVGDVFYIGHNVSSAGGIIYKMSIEFDK